MSAQRQPQRDIGEQRGVARRQQGAGHHGAVSFGVVPCRAASSRPSACINKNPYGKYPQ